MVSRARPVRARLRQILAKHSYMQTRSGQRLFREIARVTPTTTTWPIVVVIVFIAASATAGAIIVIVIDGGGPFAAPTGFALQTLDIAANLEQPQHRANQAGAAK